MGNKRKEIYSKRFPKHVEELFKETPDDFEFKRTKNSVPEGENIIDYFEKNTEYVPHPKRIADSGKFVHLVKAISEDYQIDADLVEEEAYYLATFYMDYCSYSGYLKKMLNMVSILADEFSVFSPKDNSCDFQLCYTYHTHDVYLRGRKITELD